MLNKVKPLWRILGVQNSFLSPDSRGSGKGLGLQEVPGSNPNGDKNLPIRKKKAPNSVCKHQLADLEKFMGKRTKRCINYLKIIYGRASN